MDKVYAQERRFFKDLHQSKCYKIEDFSQFCKWFTKKYGIEVKNGEKIYGKYGFISLINYYDLEW